MKSWRMGREASAFRFLVLPLVAILAVFVMAGCDGAAVGGNGQPEPAIETSPEAARTFVEKVVATGEEGADGDEVTLAVTQEEVSSFLDLASRVARVAAAQGADSLSDVERMDPATLPEGAEELPELLAMLRAEGSGRGSSSPGSASRVTARWSSPAGSTCWAFSSPCASSPCPGPKATGCS